MNVTYKPLRRSRNQLTPELEAVVWDWIIGECSTTQALRYLGFKDNRANQFYGVVSKCVRIWYSQGNLKLRRNE